MNWWSSIVYLQHKHWCNDMSQLPPHPLSWCTLAEYSATAKRISSAVLGVVCFLQANSVLVPWCIMGWLSIGTGSEDLWVQGWRKNAVLRRHLLPFGMYLKMIGHVDNTGMSKNKKRMLLFYLDVTGYNRLISPTTFTSTSMAMCADWSGSGM